MARSEDSKVRLLAVHYIMQGGKKMSARQICLELERRYGICADRKTIYSDIAAINRFVPVDVSTGVNGGFEKVDVLKRCHE